MQELISLVELPDSKHIAIGVFYKNLFLGKIIINEEPEPVIIEAEERTIAHLLFNFNGTEEVMNKVIREALSYIRKNIENDVVIFERLKINTQTNELKNAARSNGFEQNGSKELILTRENLLARTRSDETSHDKKEKPFAVRRKHRFSSAKKPVPIAQESGETQMSIITVLLENPEKILQARISELTGIGIMTVRSTIRSFQKAGFLKLDKERGNTYTVFPEIDIIKKALTDAGITIPEIPTTKTIVMPQVLLTKPEEKQKPIDCNKEKNIATGTQQTTNSIINNVETDKKPIPKIDTIKIDPFLKYLFGLFDEKIKETNIEGGAIEVLKKILEILSKQSKGIILMIDLASAIKRPYLLTYKYSTKLEDLNLVNCGRLNGGVMQVCLLAKPQDMKIKIIVENKKTILPESL